MKSDIKNIEGSEDIIKAICGEEVCFEFLLECYILGVFFNSWKSLNFEENNFKGGETE